MLSPNLPELGQFWQSCKPCQHLWPGSAFKHSGLTRNTILSGRGLKWFGTANTSCHETSHTRRRIKPGRCGVAQRLRG